MRETICSSEVTSAPQFSFCQGNRYHRVRGFPGRTHSAHDRPGSPRLTSQGLPSPPESRVDLRGTRGWSCRQPQPTGHPGREADHQRAVIEQIASRPGTGSKQGSPAEVRTRKDRSHGYPCPNAHHYHRHHDRRRHSRAPAHGCHRLRDPLGPVTLSGLTI